MLSGIEMTEPNASFVRRSGKPSLFGGSYDWHSCVIAHWCHLTAVRMQGLDEAIADDLERLSPGALAAEFEHLRQRSTSSLRTYPYDEAWFLMLIAERLRHPGSSEVLVQLRGTLEGRLLDWLETCPLPELEGRPYRGDYGSWLYTLLLVRLSDPQTTTSLERLGRLLDGRYLEHRAAFEQQGEGLADFVSLPALVALQDSLSPGSARADAAPYEAGPPSELPAEVEIRTVHPIGREISRAWPLALAAAQGGEQAEHDYDQHLAHILSRTDLWDGDFASCAHWLPQYIWIGLWFRAGMP